MDQKQWFYEINTWVILGLTLFLLSVLSYIAHRLGRWVKNPDLPNKYFLSDFIPSTILGLLALILGFTFSMTISRFEHRRELAIAEANAIGTAHLRTALLYAPHSKAIDDLLWRYLNTRIKIYHDSFDDIALTKERQQLKQLENQIWSATVDTTKKNRGAIESIFVNSLNTMIDTVNARDIALHKTLPQIIYWTILLILATGIMTFNFTRGERKELGQWQPSLLILLTSFVFYLILDIDRPREGMIQIGQDALIALRDSWNHQP